MRKIFLATILTFFLTSPAWGAWLGNYDYRVQLTLLHLQIDGAQTNFPVLITEANLPVAFFSHVAKSGVSNIDIAFTASDGVTELNREIVVFDNGGQHFEAWVKIPALSNTVDTTIYMYYGDASVTRTNDTATWSNGYAGVWHMQDATSPMMDSTANNNDGVMHGNLPEPINAKIQQGQNFDGSAGYADCGGTTGSLNIQGATPDLTIETWVEFNSLPGGGFMDFLTKGDRQWSLHRPGGSNISFFIYNTGGGATWQQIAADAAPGVGNWYHVVGRYTNAGNEVAMFINGIKQTATLNPGGGINDDGQKVYLGQNSQVGGRFLNGMMDEARVQNVARSDTWISTEFNNENNPGSFYSVGTESAHATPTQTETSTCTPTTTDSPTASPTITFSPTISATPTMTPTGTITGTITPTNTVSPTITMSGTITPTSTRSATFTQSATASPSYTRTPTSTPTTTVSPTFTQSPVVSATPTSTRTPTRTPTSTLTCTPSITPLRPAAGDLNHVVVYPNPFRADRGPEKRVIFTGLTPKATIRIYTVTGQLVRTLEKNDAYAAYTWDLNNSQGSAVASGVYLYLIKSDQGEAHGKLAVVR